MESPIRVLHVDDDPAFLELAATLLEREGDGFEIHTATSAAEGRTLLDREAIDCVVSDHDMPGENGIEFLQSVRKADPDLPFILFTGKGSEEIASEAISAGVTDYLQKETGTDQYTILANRIDNAVERYRSGKQIAAQKRRLETLVDNLPGVVYRCRNEPNWPMEFIDGECESLTGYPAESIESGDLTWGGDVIHPDDRTPVYETVQESIAVGEPFEYTYRIQTADGETKWVWERGRGVPAPLTDPASDPSTIDEEIGDAETGDAETGDAETDASNETATEAEVLEGFITDITERKVRERELQRRTERLDQFARVISHDLQGPIAAATGRLELALETGDLDHVVSAAEAVDRIDALRKDIASTLKSGEIVSEREAIPIEQAVQSARRAVDLPESTRIEVQDAIEITADPDAFARLLENLLRNSIEHGGDDVSIRISTLAEDPGIVYEDDGPGIPPEDRTQVFTPGYSTKASGTGIGMGMASVQQIVTAHDWSIGIADAEGLDGVRFEIRTG